MGEKEVYTTVVYITTNICHIFPGLPQYEATKAYMPKEPDDLGLQQAELVIVLRKEEGQSVYII